MSRAINLNVVQTEVSAMCAHHKVEISAIEPLLCGGTRVVLMNTDHTAVITKAFKTKIITGEARRVPIFLGRR